MGAVVKFKFLLTAFFLTVFSVSGWAIEIFSYEISGFPRGEISCLSEAQNVADSLSKSNGVEVYKAVCVKEASRTYDFRIDYLAERPLNLVSTSGPQGYQGMYEKREQCEADRSRQAQLFQERTGIKPIVAYCRPYSSLSGSGPYDIKVDGFGSPKERPFIFNMTIFDKPYAPTGENPYFDFMKNLAQEDVSPALLWLSTSNSELGVLYYAKKEARWVRASAQFYFHNPNDCSSELALMRTALRSQKAILLYSACGWDPLLFRASINLITKPQSTWYRRHYTPDKYPNMAACSADRDSVVDYYKNKLGKPVFAGVCEQGAGRYNSPYRLRLLYACVSPSAIECLDLDPPEFPWVKV